MFEFEEKQGVTGDFHLRVLRNGQPIEQVDDHNLVVYTGRARLAQLLAGKTTNTIAYVGVGSGAATELDADTQLTDQQTFTITGSSVDGRDARFDFLIKESEANGLAIREFGLFCEDGTMFSHRVRRRKDTGTASVIDKQDDISIEGYWIIHF